MHSILKRAFAALALLVFSGAAFLPTISAAPDALSVLESGADATVPLGSFLRADGDLTLRGTLRVIGAEGDVAPVVTITTPGRLVVEGSLLMDATALRGPDAQRAPSGGILILQAAEVVLTETSLLQTANGVPGADATASGAGMTALAQHGGHGGSVLLLADTVTTNGRLLLGNGAPGGRALGVLSANAIAGDGGDSGGLWHITSTGTSLLASGDGGDGGNAESTGNGTPFVECSQDHTGANGADGWNGGANGENAKSTGCEGDPGSNGENGKSFLGALCTSGTSGHPGKAGFAAGTARGGKGGNGGSGAGGNGGLADSVGGTGGAGGNGGKPGTSYILQCEEGNGGNGGGGGNGLSAIGGQGGCGWPDGAGGAASAPAGNGGAGGSGKTNGENGAAGAPGTPKEGGPCDRPLSFSDVKGLEETMTCLGLVVMERSAIDPRNPDPQDLEHLIAIKRECFND